MLVGDALNAAVQRMAPPFSDAVLGAGVAGLSTLLAGAGFGATFAALWLAQGGGRRARSHIIMAAFLGFVLAVAALMLAPTLAWAAAAMAVLGAAFEIARTGTVTLLQVAVPDGLRGRVMSTQVLMMRLAGALSVAVIGAVADDVGLRGPMLGFAGVALVVWAGAARRRATIAQAFAGRGS